MLSLEKEKENQGLKAQYDKISEELKACKSFSDTSSILLQNQENELR